MANCNRKATSEGNNLENYSEVDLMIYYSVKMWGNLIFAEGWRLIFVSHFYRINKTNCNLFAFRQLLKYSALSSQYSLNFKSYFAYYFALWSKENIGKFRFAHLCSCPDRQFPAEDLCILLVEIHTGTRKFFHQMHKVISEENQHSPGCILCLCLDPPSKTRKK